MSSSLLAWLFLGLLAQAQTTLYWDINGSAAGAGGATPSGTWKTSGAANTNWSTSSAGTATTAVWTANDVAVFSAGTDATGAYTVTVSGTQSVDSMLINAGTIDFTGGTLSLTGTTPGITVASGLAATFDSKLTGSNGLVINGAGTVLLNNTGNTYTGATTVSLGTLQVGATGNNILPTTTALTIASDASVALLSGSTAQAVGSLTGAGSLNLGNNTFKVGDTTNTTFSGAIADDGSGTSVLQKTGTGTLTLSGTSTFNGAVNVSAGTLVAASSGALGAAGSGNTIANGATLALSGNSILNTTAWSVNGTGASTNSAIENLSGANSLGGTITLSGNTTVASDAGTLTLTGDVGLGARTLTASGAGNINLSGAISGTGKFIEAGGGTTTLSGTTANTFSGTTTINDGTLQLGKTAGVAALGAGAITIGDGTGAGSSANLVLLANTQLSGSASITLNSDGRLALNNFTQSIDKLSGTGLVDLGASGSLTVGAANGSSSFNGTVTGGGNLIKAGTGTLTFNSSFNFTGTLTLSGGTISLNAITLSVGTLHITGNTVLDFGASTASTLNATTFIVDAGVTLTVINWANAVDYFYAQNWTGATLGGSGTTPENQLTFSGYSNNSTQWQSYDDEVTPAPESAFYGAVFIGLTLAWVLWHRRPPALLA